MTSHPFQPYGYQFSFFLAKRKGRIRPHMAEKAPFPRDFQGIFRPLGPSSRAHALILKDCDSLYGNSG
jgi:hypothetical protein